MTSREPLYGESEAACLQWREALRESDRLKLELLAEHIGTCGRLLDLGCGWGQLLGRVEPQVEEAWGADESEARIRDVRQVCPAARMVICRGEALGLADGRFDVVVTSQMLHEPKLFGREGELERTLGEIQRVLCMGGRYLLLDHLDAGDGEVVVDLPAAQVSRLEEFERKFRFYEARHDLTGEGHLRIARRCLQDFLTKDCWLGTHMESMEMDETHNAFTRAEAQRLVAGVGLEVEQWVEFTDIADDLARHGGHLIDGEPWSRKFLLAARKV